MKKRNDQEQNTFEIRFPNPDGTVDIWIYDTSKRPYRVIEVTVNVRSKK